MFARFFITLALFAGFVASVPAQDFNIQGKVIFDRNPVTGQITGATCSVGWNTISCPPNLLREVQQQTIYRTASQGGCQGIAFDGAVPFRIDGLVSAFRLGGCLNTPREELQTRVVVVQQVTQVVTQATDAERKRPCVKIDDINYGMMTDRECAVIVPRGVQQQVSSGRAPTPCPPDMVPRKRNDGNPGYCAVMNGNSEVKEQPLNIGWK